MKLFLLTVLLTSPVLCNSGYPDRGRFICVSKEKDCITYNTDNHLSMSFSSGHFQYFNKRCVVGIFGAVENHTDSVLHFDRQNFQLNSNQQEYELHMRKIMKNSKHITLPDTFSLRPGEVDDVYVFEFWSKNKMSRQEYYKILAGDTVNLIFSRSAAKDTILRMIHTTERY